MTLRDSIKADSLSVFLQTDEFAECIVYLPRGGGSRTINAIVDREPPEIYDAAGNVVKPRYMVQLHNNSDTGICSKEVDTGGDQMQIKKEFGDTVPETVTVLAKVDEDMGMITLALR